MDERSVKSDKLVSGGEVAKLTPRNPKNKKFSGSPYIGDKQLLFRVDKYLDEKMDMDVIDKEAMVEELRAQYPEYGRRNKSAFKATVLKAFNIVMQSSLNAEERLHLSGSSDLDLSSEESDTAEYDEDDDFPDDGDLYAQCTRTSSGSKRINGSMPYIQSVQKMTSSVKSNSSNQELINISSDDDDKEKPEKSDLKTAAPVHKGVLFSDKKGGTGGSSSLPKISLPPGTLLFPPNNALLLRSKRKVGMSGGDSNGGLPSTFLPNKRQRISENTLVPKQTFKDFGGKPEILETVSQVILHMKYPAIFRKLGVSPPRGFLLHGPPGSGKTLLAHAIAGELKVPLVKVAAPELVAGVSGESELRIRELFDQAANQVPCVLFIDEVDAITPRRETALKDMERRIVAQLLASLDELSQRPEYDQVLVVGATNRADALDPALRRAGRFDREICLGIPDTAARESILQVVCSSLRLHPTVSLHKLAMLTPGYVGADLKALTSEAAMAAVNRILKKAKIEKGMKKQLSEDTSSSLTSEDVAKTSNETPERKMEVETNPQQNNEQVCGENIVVEKVKNGEKDKHQSKSVDYENTSILQGGLPLTEKQLEDLYIETEDFEAALKTVQPSAKREGFATVPDVTWDDIGSLRDIRDQLEMSIMMPVKYPEEFARFGVTSPTGILLCGPPGCGKTLLAKAVANEANINFISVKGPELLNMYVGESERAVRQCFQRARNSQPCVIFFDEIDALCPKRSDAVEGSASSRVVNQLLTEMDGVEGRSNVFLMAATNRPDMVDPAVMRPGRFDKILYVGMPSPKDRADILKALTKNGTRPPFEDGVALDTVAMSERCRCYTGADISALIKEASVLALAESIEHTSACPDSVGHKLLAVGYSHLEQALERIRPSVSDKDLRKYEEMRRQYAEAGTSKIVRKDMSQSAQPSEEMN